MSLCKSTSLSARVYDKNLILVCDLGNISNSHTGGLCVCGVCVHVCVRACVCSTLYTAAYVHRNVRRLSFSFSRRNNV